LDKNSVDGPVFSGAPMQGIGGREAWGAAPS
jgi:hypothetical protein